MQKITSCLWFDGEAEEAVRFYIDIFPDSRIVRVFRSTGDGEELHGRARDSILSIEFELSGQAFTALNGGPHFQFNEAHSLQVDCADQAEVDYYWERLAVGTDPETRQCGWLKDRYGLSWQIIPQCLGQIWEDADPEAASRVMRCMLGMKKLVLADLEAAYSGED